MTPAPPAGALPPAKKDPTGVRAAKYLGFAAGFAGLVVLSTILPTGSDALLNSPTDLLIPAGLFLLLYALAYGLGQAIGVRPWDTVAPRLLRALAAGFLGLWITSLLGEPIIGLVSAVLVLGLALNRSYADLKALGFKGSAPVVGILAATVLGGGIWLALRQFFGEYVWFTAVSILFALAYVVAIVTVVTATFHRAKAVEAGGDARAARKAQLAPVVTAVAAYLVFRLFLSEQIPYGPIIEWLAICMGATLFAYAASKRIGVVPTRLSIPPDHVRLHEQKVELRSDPDLRRLEDLVSAFVQRGARRKELAREVQAALAERGYAESEARQAGERILAHEPERGGLFALTREGKALRERNATERSRLLGGIAETVRRPAAARRAEAASPARGATARALSPSRAPPGGGAMAG